MLSSEGRWQLAPAYDLVYSYKPGSKWVNSHWMSINGKRDNFTREDFYSFEKLSPLFTKKMIDTTLDETIERASQWAILAAENRVPKALIKTVSDNLRLSI